MNDDERKQIKEKVETLFEVTAGTVSELICDGSNMKQFRKNVKCWNRRQEEQWKEQEKPRKKQQKQRVEQQKPTKQQQKQWEKQQEQWQIEPLFPLPDRQLALQEQYVVLAAIYDSVARGIEKIDPWYQSYPQGDTEKAKAKALDLDRKGVHYHVLAYSHFNLDLFDSWDLDELHQLTFGIENSFNQFLNKVKMDLKAKQEEQTKPGTGEKTNGGNAGNTKPKQRITLKDFIKKHCDLSEKPDINSKCEMLMREHRIRRIKLPLVEAEYRKGQTYLYWLEELHNNWPIFRMTLTTLPTLKGSSNK